jgi:predicted nucleotidyltransferase
MAVSVRNSLGEWSADGAPGSANLGHAGNLYSNPTGTNYDLEESKRLRTEHVISVTVLGERRELARSGRSPDVMAGLMREHVRPAVFGSALRDESALGDLMKTVTRSVGISPVSSAMAGLMREHVRPAVFGSALRDESALGDLMKTVTRSVGSGDIAALVTAAKVLGTAAAPRTDRHDSESDPVGSTKSSVEPGQEVQSKWVSDGAEVYAALAALIMLSLLVACWLYEAERVGPDFAAVNRFDLLQSAQWAVALSVLTGATVYRCMRGKPKE